MPDDRTVVVERFRLFVPVQFWAIDLVERECELATAKLKDEWFCHCANTSIADLSFLGPVPGSFAWPSTLATTVLVERRWPVFHTDNF